MSCFEEPGFSANKSNFLFVLQGILKQEMSADSHNCVNGSMEDMQGVRIQDDARQ